MTQPPIVTIGLPVYNSERHLEQSLKSLLAQSYQNFILIISDNASTDKTSQICQEYANADARIRYYRNETNIGNPRNFNRVFELTRTKYLKWSTADDYWEPTFLERALEIMERDPTVALCYPQAVIVDADGDNRQNYDDVLNLVNEDPTERFLALISTIGLAHQHLGVIRMSHLRQTHLLATHVGSDINLLAELTLYGKFVELPDRLFYRRFHENSGSWKRGDAAHEAKRYHSSGAGLVKMTRWPTHLRHFSAVNTSPLPIRSKARLNWTLLRRMLWDRRQLRIELISYILRWVR